MRLKVRGFKVKFIRCDGAPEYKSLDNKLTREGFNIVFEYTAPNTPQFNGKVERKFATGYTKIRALLNEAQLSSTLRHGLWCEAAARFEEDENLIVTRNNPESPFKKMYGKEIPGWRERRIWGEMAIVDYGSAENSMKKKTSNRGYPCIYLGRAKNHSSDTNRFLNLKTLRTITSRDVRWLGKMYGEWRGLKQYDLHSKLEEEIIDFDKPSDGENDNEDLQENSMNDEADREEETNYIEIEENDEVEDKVNAEDLNEDPDPEENENDAPTNTGIETDENEDNDKETQYKEINEEMRNDEDDDDENNGLDENPAKAVGKIQRELKSLSWWDQPSSDLGRTRSKTTRNLELQEEKLDKEPGRESEEETDDTDKFESASVLIEKCMSTVEYAMIAEEHQSIAEQIEKARKMRPEDVPPEMRKHVWELPKNFAEAWNHECAFQRKLWREAITLEFGKMNEHEVWTKIKQSEKPRDRRCVKCKWVLEIKRDGRFRARLVACGYSQIPGLDYELSYSPVVSDETIRILLVVGMVLGYIAKLVDVSTAFLHGDLKDTEIYMMDCPPGMKHKEDECLRLNKSIYGLVQSARAYWEKTCEVFEAIGFTRSFADACLFVKKLNDGRSVMVATWVDDCYFMGPKDEVNKAIEDFKKYFKVTITSDTTDYLGCEIIYNPQRTRCWIGQPSVLKKIEKKFGEKVKKLKEYVTPGTPNWGVILEEDETKLDSNRHMEYRSGVGMLLYLVKYSRPDLANAVRELSKGVQSPNEMCWKELMRVIKFTLDTRRYGLKFEIEDKTSTMGKLRWEVQCFSDSDWAGDKTTRKSVSGYVIYFMGCPIVWKSRQQSVIGLSSSEAELYACIEAVKEVKYLVQLLQSMEIEVELPVTIRVDNTGAIFMAENLAVSQRTKHIDLRARYLLNQLADERLIKLVHVGTKENKSDIMTKNVTKEVYENLKGGYVEKLN